MLAMKENEKANEKMIAYFTGGIYIQAAIDAVLGKKTTGFMV
jgi:hypothetical protein